MKRHIRRAIKAALPGHLFYTLPGGFYLFREFPGGVDFRHDICRYLPKLNIESVFDVGANIGQSAIRFKRAFPGATVYCFEPASTTFAKLCATCGDHPHIRCFQLAFSSKAGTCKMIVSGNSPAYRLGSSEDEGDHTEDVPLATVDGFCAEQCISRINLLKIDTEGHDLEVLKGASELLRTHRIDLVQVEAGMNCRNSRQVPIESIKEHLEEMNFFLFRVYDQVPEWPTREPHLRRSNLVFLSERVISLHTIRQ